LQAEVLGEGTGYFLDFSEVFLDRWVALQGIEPGSQPVLAGMDLGLRID
jgi:hypothetical protein